MLDLGDGPAEGDATDDADLDGVELAPEDFEDVDDAEQAAASGSGSAVAGPDMAARVSTTVPVAKLAWFSC